MQIPVPLPSGNSSVLLLLFLPGVLALGWWVAYRTTRSRLLALILAPGFSLALWIEATHLTGYATHSFYVALWGVSAALGLGGYATLWRDPPRWTTLRRFWRFKDNRRMLVVAALATLLLAPIALRASFHDEGGVDGHFDHASLIQNGYYPPPDPSFPSIQQRYHYGYDLVTAAVSTVLRTNVSVAGDIVTIACWGYVWILAWAIGRRVAGSWGGPITALVLAYGAGDPLVCPSQVRSHALGAQLLGFCKTGGFFRNPPYISYHFQHPWAVGLPIALCLMLVIDVAPRRAPRWIAVGWLVATLAISEIVLFASMLAALPVAELVMRRGRSDRWKSVGLTLAAVVVAFVVASHSGGFFSPGPRALGLEIHPGIAATWGSSAEWVLHVFGLMLVLGVAGHFMARRPLVVYGLLALGGLVVINSVRYRFTWDIVKFATVATIGLAIPSAVVLARLMARRGLVLRATGWLGLAAVIASGVGIELALVLQLPGVPRMYRHKPRAMAKDDRRAATWLRAHMRPPDVMYRNQRHCSTYAAWAGLSQAFFDARNISIPAMGRRRSALLRHLPGEPGPYLKQGIRFFVLDRSDRRLRGFAGRWIKAGEARQRARFGGLEIIELTPRQHGIDGRRVSRRYRTGSVIPR